MAFAGDASNAISIVPRARTEAGLVSRSRLAALSIGPEPPGFLPKLARKGHRFSEQVMHHGFYKNISVDLRRYKELKMFLH